LSEPLSRLCFGGPYKTTKSRIYLYGVSEPTLINFVVCTDVEVPEVVEMGSPAISSKAFEFKKWGLEAEGRDPQLSPAFFEKADGFAGIFSLTFGNPANPSRGARGSSRMGSPGFEPRTSPFVSGRLHVELPRFSGALSQSELRTLIRLSAPTATVSVYCLLGRKTF
jgi:hypothetical protein